MGWTLKQFNGNAMKMDLGYTAYEFEGVPWVIDTDSPATLSTPLTRIPCSR